MKKYTMNPVGLVVFIALIGLGIFDLYMVVFKGTGSSISNFLTNAGFTSPIFNFVVGAICGHALFPMQPEKKDEPTKSN